MKTLIIILFVLITATACSKKDDPTPEIKYGKVTFYMSPTSHRWDLLVDGADCGALLGSAFTPVCGDPNHITLTLSTGIHSVDAKSLDGLAWGNPINFSVTDDCLTYKVR